MTLLRQNHQLVVITRNIEVSELCPLILRGVVFLHIGQRARVVPSNNENAML